MNEMLLVYWFIAALFGLSLGVSILAGKWRTSAILGIIMIALLIFWINYQKTVYKLRKLWYNKYIR